ncbi:MAG: tetratricopeptide repeat protein, partial [Gammaproteobacteria bacterium]
MILQIPGRMCALCLLSVTLVCAAPQVRADLPHLDALIQAQNYPAAYTLATELEAEFAGQADFDFLYAIAAIESGHVHQAIFALERLISQFPDNGRIKVELGRAHFLIGDLQTARDLFAEVLATTPPDNVQKKVRAFIQVIDERQLVLQNRLSAWFKLSAGWDSNYNSAPDLSVIQIGGIDFSINENNRQQDTGYTGIEANLSYRQLLSKKLLMNYAAYYQQRQNIGNALDTDTVGIQLSPLIASAWGNWRFPLQLQQLYLDGDDYRQYASLGMEWTPSPSPASQWSHFLQYGAIRYTEQAPRDVNLAIIGSSYQHVTNRGNLYQLALFFND